MSSNPAPNVLIDEAAAGAVAAGDDPATPTGPEAPVALEVALDAIAVGTAPIVVLLDPRALEVARTAAVGEAGRADLIGEFLVALAEDDVAITATFEAKQPGYLDWQWSVTLAVVAADHPTVSEVVLLPGKGALLAPAWIPWDERIRPGDLGAGDLLPPRDDDPRVVPAYLQSDDPAVEAVATELGIGRVRVLSREGRIDFAERLHDGMFGPSDEVALAAPGHCVTCAFYLPLAGSLGQLIGACGNEFSPADGRTVDAGYGCGAHSETVIEMPARSATALAVIDELSLEVHRRPRSGPSVESVDPVESVDSVDPVVEIVEIVEIAEADLIDPMSEADPDVLDAVLTDALDAEHVPPATDTSDDTD